MWLIPLSFRGSDLHHKGFKLVLELLLESEPNWLFLSQPFPATLNQQITGVFCYLFVKVLPICPVHREFWWKDSSPPRLQFRQMAGKNTSALTSYCIWTKMSQILKPVVTTYLLFLFVLWFDISRSISQCKKHLMVWLVCQLCCTLERRIHHTQISWIKNYQSCEKTAITCDITLNSVTRFGEITNWYSFPAKR